MRRLVYVSAALAFIAFWVWAGWYVASVWFTQLR